MTAQKKYFDDTGALIVRPYMVQDLARIYNVSGKTIRRWINETVPESGKKTKKFFSLNQVQEIIKGLGNPSSIILK